MREAWSSGHHDRGIAAVVVVLVLALLLSLLRLGPEGGSGADGERIQVRFLRPLPTYAGPVPRQPADTAVAPLAQTPAIPAPAARIAARPDSRDEAASTTIATTPAAEGLYTRQGQVRIADAVELTPEFAAHPPGVTNERERHQAERVLERRNPVEYRETVFDQAKRDLAGGQSRIEEIIFGKDRQAIAARPPPEVRFNPALHERSADLGSEATGNAYQAAPIAFEKAPGLDGEASRRIRSGIAEVEKRHAGCDGARRQHLLEPARRHLADLERTEYAHAHGADPVQAEHLLPRQADSAYNLARRALWYARDQLQACRG
ncbi:hypothetical protein [Pseudoxanthomonas kalamensis]|uniref:hypothetical protein n=1 Tax=Pseudoxanthomonas kalamensis TaxID=289483 RepID=UPI00139203AA|nr:hypothetical protein [Pseudoxanthomonas kalamensis]